MRDSHTAPAVAIVTLGCPKNEVDSDRMAAALLASTYRLVEEPDCADVVIVNTCSFIREATEESIATVLELATSWAPGDPNRKLVVAGCMPSRYGSELASELVEVDAFLPVAEEGELIGLLERLTGVPAVPATEVARALRTASGPSAYLMVSDGCHRKCTYCTIPSIRGPYVSRSLPELLEETAQLVASGAREIVLIGQDITAWGRDLEGALTLADVVRAVAAVPGVDWLRLMYAQPDGITDELLETLATTPNACHYLDIPLQHASEPVLRAMGRRGNERSLLELVTRIREALPDCALRTTFIAGFPGETRTDAAALERFVAQAGFDYVGVFPYSAEEGTVAAGLPDQVPARTRRARAQRLRDVADEVGVARTEAMIGREVDVLIEGYDEDEDAIVGRWRGQAPEVDGIVMLDRGEAGQLVRARITDTFGYDLEAEVL